MKNLFLIILLGFSSMAMAQPAGYYNGTEGKTGDELKEALNTIISDHMEWAYFYASDIFLQSDADPATPGNVITVYKGSSVDGGNYGVGGDYLNREHVWAKSHGQFDTDLPTGGDVHNLKPADGSVNVGRSNKDFDNCQETGTQHSEATGCYYTADAWEPRDEVKGDIARIIFYMATRYEGNNGEVDLEVNDEVDNSPQPFHGRLSALLEWNMQDLPDAFERNRNDKIFAYQQNRNPFIDNPEWVNMIWESAPASTIEVGEVAQSQELVFVGETIDISATITGTTGISATLNWGTTYTALTNTIEMNANGDAFSAQIPAQTSATEIYFSITAESGSQTGASVVYNYSVQEEFNGTIQTIAEVQGEQAASPLADQEVTITGVVTGNFGEGFFVQDGIGPWSGVYVYDVLNPRIGDSVILTGTVAEYYDLTEIIDVTNFHIISRNNVLPDPIILSTDEVGEAYEGVLISIRGVSCTNEDLGYGMWEVSDANGSLGVHNTQIYEIEPQLNTIYDITGPCKYDYGEFKIELRMESDVSSGDHTAPTVNEIVVRDMETIFVVFNERLMESTATNPDNYSINGGVNVLQASEGFPLSKIQLTVENLSEGDYEITISNIEDISGNPMETQTIPFTTLGIEGDFAQNISVYPNPTKTGNVEIENAISVASIEVFDTMGKMVERIENTNASANLTVTLSTQGVYFLHFTSKDGEVGVVKVIAQ